MITSKQRAFLRGKANDIDAIFQIGKDGVNENMIAQLNDVLESRELIKIKVLETAMLTAREASEIVCEATGAEPVQCIGSKFVIYRPNSEKAIIILPKA
ncbi:MAG: ribosome assembly RNA-binding protein YhbY [Clostridia bacterium]|nr:ribosome assembly RNA-binding protein YhbY [Clostridia bacterium]